MNELKIKTSISFPYFKIGEKFTYEKVDKPSGVAYILLVLIKDFQDKSKCVSDILLSFGIPETLHDIFLTTLKELHRVDLIRCGAYIGNLAIPIRLLTFTEKGEKMFQDEMIPSGIVKTGDVNLYYDIAKNELTFKIDDALKPRRLINSYLPSRFFEQFSFKSHFARAENFLMLHRGEKWPQEKDGEPRPPLVLKKEEVITGVVAQNLYREIWIAERALTVSIKNDVVDLSMGDAVLQNFFEKYYRASDINNAIQRDENFKIDESYRSLKLTDYEAVEIKLPFQLENLLTANNKFIVSRRPISIPKVFAIVNNRSPLGSNENAEYIVIDNKDDVYSIIPGVFDFQNEKFGTIRVPLILKVKATLKELQCAARPYLSTLMAYDEANFQELVRITNYTKDIEGAEAVMKKCESDNPEDNIVWLKKIEDRAVTNSEIFKFYKKLLADNYYKYLQTVTNDNLGTILQITKNIPKLLGLDNDETLKECRRNLKMPRELFAYELFVKNGYNSSSVALYFNPVPEALQASAANDIKLLNAINDIKLLNLVKFSRNLNALKSLLKPKDEQTLFFDNENFDVEQFQKLYKSLCGWRDSIEIFRANNKELFQTYDRYMKIFEPINNDINIKTKIARYPEKITKKMIEKIIVSGDDRAVFAHLAVKLEYILAEKYSDKKEKGLYQLIKSANDIDEETLTELHAFRKTRNDTLHYDCQPEYTAQDLRKWNDIIFALEEKK